MFFRILLKNTQPNKHAANSVIGKGCIVSVGAIVDHDTVLENCTHVNAGAIVKAGAHVLENQKIDAGEIVPGF